MTNGPRTCARRTLGVVVTLLAVSQGVVMSAPSAQAAYSPSAATVAAYEARVIWRMNVVRAAYHRGRLAPATSITIRSPRSTSLVLVYHSLITS